MVKAQREECLASGGAIFLCNDQTRKECFEKKIFGLSPNYADFVKEVKAGTTLFLYDTCQHQLHGVFEATSDGALDIIPDAFSAGPWFPYQIRFKRIWFCKPLTEGEFQDAVQNSFVVKKQSTFRLSHQQVTKLLYLFSSRKRLWPPQNPRSQDDRSREFETSSLKETDMQSSPNSNSCGSLTSYFSILGEDATSQNYRLIDTVSAHRELQSGVSFISMFNSTISSLHSGADTAVVTIPSNQGAICDQATDDYIPLPQEEDVVVGVDDLFGFLEDDYHSSEFESSSDSEDGNSFRQARVTKEDECYPIMVNSTLRSDMEKRKSVFSRIGPRKRSNVKAFPQIYPRKRSNVKAFPQMRFEGTVMLPQDEHYYSCYGHGSENRNSSDHVSITNTFSFDGSQSCAHADDQECYKVVAR